MSLSRQPRSKLSSSTSLSRVAGKLSLMAMLMATGAMMTPAKAFAIDAGELPTNGTVVGGDASFDYSQPNKLDIHQNTDRAVINWESFNIGKDATTQFYQPNSNSLAVNRVYSKGVDPTQILGKLIANGKVMVLDRNGVIFGKDAVIDVGGIIASTGDINVNQVMSGANKIDITNISNAAVVNNGLINVQEAGLAGLVAKSAINNGVIKAKVGRVALASGDKATVDLYGDQLIEIAVDSNLETALASNTGTISAEGGTVQITASAAKNAVDSVVNTSGIIEVSSVEVKGGKIILGGGGSTVKVSGKVAADGATGGGKIDIKGQDVTVSEGTEISANAVTNGNGGTVDLIADNIMDFSGIITARGGVVSGNGGEVEVSGYEGLNYAGLADLTAANGEMGNLLLDPRFMVIYGSVIPASSTYSISAARLAQQIRTADVTIQADQYIDVGTKDGVYNENVGNFLTNLATNAALNLLPDGNVDLSTFLVTQSSFPFFATGTTAGNLTLKSATVNFNKDLTVGNGNLTVDAGTVNLGSKIYASNGTTLLGDSRLIGTSAIGTINVGANGKINQGVGFADDATALTTINVAAGTYAESVNVNKANVALKGNGVLNGTKITPNSPGIVISANDVTVDGFTVIGASGASDGYSIIVDGFNNATISNNFVIGSQLDGIKVNASNSTEVTGNTVTGSGRVGIYGGSATNLLIDGNTVTSNTFAIGSPYGAITTDFGSGITISDNTVSDSTHGIRVYQATGANEVSGNTIDNVRNSGVWVDGTANILVSGNTIDDTGSHAVDILNSANSSATGNFIGTNGLVGNIKGDGILIENSGNTSIDGNTIQNTTSSGDDIGSGIHIVTSNGVTIGTTAANTISNVAWDGIKTYLSDATIENNVISDTGRTGIFAVGGFNVTADNNSVTNATLEGIFFQNVSTGVASISGNTVNGTGADGIRANSVNGIVIDANVLGLGADGIVGTADDTIIGNDGIRLAGTSNAQVTNNNLANTNRHGIVLTNGKTDVTNNVVTGNTVDNTARNGIYLNRSVSSDVSGNFIGTNTASGTIDGDGILVENSGNTSIDGNTIQNTTSSGDDIGSGIHIVSSNGVTIGTTAANTISNVAWDGIKTYLSDAIIENNVISDTGRTGIFAVGGFNVTADNNSVTNATLEGIFFQNVSTGVASISGNTVNGTGADGIRANSVNGIVIDANVLGLGADGIVGTADDTIIGNDGIRLAGTSNAQVTNNNLANTNRHGIVLTNGKTDVTNNVVTGNTVDNTARNGIYLNRSVSSDVSGNFIGTNTASGTIDGDGILVENSGNTSIDGNTIQNTTSSGDDIGSGIHIVSSNGVTIGTTTANQISNVAWDGIKLNVSDATISNNVISDTGRSGIYAFGGTNVVVSGNTVSDAAAQGIFFQNFASVNTASITGNTVNGTGADGIRANSVDGIVIDSNFVGLGADGILGTADDAAATIGTDGIRLAGTSNAQVTNNNIANANRFGIFASNGKTAVTGNVITGNTIDAVAQHGIYLNQSNNTLVQGNNVGLGFDLIAGTADDSVVGTDGIRVANSLLASILDNLVANASGSGLFVEDMGSNTVTVAGNEVTNSNTGMTFESGLIDLTGSSNTVTGGVIGYHFEPKAGASVNLVGNTIGSTIFAGQSQYYVELANGALFNPGTPTVISAIDTSFDGLVPNTIAGLNLTQTQYDQIANGIYDFNIDPTLGLFFFGFAPDIDQSDIFRQIAGIPGVTGRLSITIRGLPRIAGVNAPTLPTTGPQSFSLNDITPAAGGDATDGTNNATGATFDQIDPAAGGTDAQATSSTCWGDVIAAASSGQSVTYDFGSGGSEAISAVASCSSRS